MYDFQLHKPTSLMDAQRLAASCSEPLYLAGGQTLLPTLKQRLAKPSDVIDLSAVPELSGSIGGGAGEISIPAMTKHQDVADNALVLSQLPALAKLAGGIGDPHVRNMGTIGGSLANSDPAADYPAALLGLKGKVVTQSREIAGDDFFAGFFETALEPGEIITQVCFTVPDSAAYEKFPNPASRYAMAGVMVARYGDGVRVGVTGAGPYAFRAADYEQKLNASFSPDALDGPVADDDLNDDLHGSAAYRAQLVWVLARRAVAALL